MLIDSGWIEIPLKKTKYSVGCLAQKKSEGRSGYPRCEIQ